MCGISGWINFSNEFNLNSNEHIEIIKKMNNTIIHRGPNQEGYWVNENALLGHRRLDITDKEGGRQPMIYKTNEGKSIVICLNGELYNFKELKLQLQQLGYSFKSESDSEVFLLSYIEWGDQCLNYFNGVFAFAIYDERESKLFLARDHLGVKPLFYCTRDNSILIGSELKVLLANDKLVEPIVDEQGIAQLFYMGPFRFKQNGCIFKNIYELAGGRSITFYQTTLDSTSLSPPVSFKTIGEIVYWDLKSYKHQDDLETTTKTIRQLLEKSIIEQTVSNLPISMLISGGLDSSSLAGLTSILAKTNQLSELSPINGENTKLKTYAISFEKVETEKSTPDHIDSDEYWTQKVIEHILPDHTTVVIGDYFSQNSIILKSRELPGFGHIDSMFYLLMKGVSQGSVISLSGDGSDEIFSAYPCFANKNILNTNRVPWIGNCFSNINLYLSDEVLNRIDYKKYGEQLYNELTSNVPRLEGEDPIKSKQREFTYLYIKHFMAALLERTDRLSMENSLEVRFPFCNYKLVEYCFNIPYNLKTIDNIDKGILRKSMIGTLPNDILYRKKWNYSFSQDEKYIKSISTNLKSILDNPDSPVLKFFKQEKLQKIIDTQSESKYNWLIEYIYDINQWIIQYNVKFV